MPKKAQSRPETAQTALIRAKTILSEDLRKLLIRLGFVETHLVEAGDNLLTPPHCSPGPAMQPVFFPGPPCRRAVLPGPAAKPDFRFTRAVLPACSSGPAIAPAFPVQTTMVRAVRRGAAREPGLY